MAEYVLVDGKLVKKKEKKVGNTYFLNEDGKLEKLADENVGETNLTEKTSGKGSPQSSSYSSTYARLRKKAIADRKTIDGEYINKFAADADSFTARHFDIYNNSGYGDTQSAYDSYKSELASFQTRANNINTYISSYGVNLSAEDKALVDSILGAWNTNINSLTSAYTDKLGMISGYGSEDEYNSALRTSEFLSKYENTSYKDRKKALSELEVRMAEEGILKGDDAALDSEVDFLRGYGIRQGYATSAEYDEEINDLWHTIEFGGANYAKNTKIGKELRERIVSLEAARDSLKEEENIRAKYGKYTEAEDFAEGSKYVSTAKNLTDAEIEALGYKKDKTGEWYKNVGLGGVDYYESAGDMVYEYINADEATQAEMMQAERAEMYSSGAVMVNEDTVKSSKYKTYAEMDDEEVALYNYLYAQDKESAQKYLDSLSASLNRRFDKKETERLTALGRKNPIASSIISIGTNVSSGLFAPAKVIASVMGEDEAVSDSSARITAALRAGAGEWASGWDANIPLINKNAGEFVYGSLMSLADMGVSAAIGGLLGGGNVETASKITQGIMSSSAASSAVYEAHQNGVGGLEAALKGISAGAIEWITEKYSVENLLGESGRGIIRNALKQMGIEATEEAAATALNTVVDEFISELAGHESELESQVTNLIKSGMSREEAKRQVTSDWWRGVGADALAGALTGALMGGGTSAISSTGTGLTQNEQAVVDREVERRVAEAEKDGGKVSKKDHGKIREDVMRDLDRGYISTDTIEEALGGETYQELRHTIDSEDALTVRQNELQEEYNTLHSMKRGEMTGEQIDREAELKSKLDELKTKTQHVQENSRRGELKSRLSDEVFSLVKDSRLSESYNERTRRTQAFEADVSKYNKAQRETVQRAIDSGILNNTNRTHDFVDMIAKISADRGVAFDFTNNEKLRESGFALDGRVVNGYISKDGISLNINSSKALNSVVGHEITHVLEGTDFYAELQGVIFEYAKSKGDYDGRLEAVAELYKGIEDADVNAELCADLVGDYLFTDADFVHHLSAKNRNVFRKIYDEVKYLVKVATAGSREARQLEKIKRAFDKAYRAQKNTAQVDGVRYSVGKTFEQQVDDVINGIHNPRHDLYVSETPKIFTELGFSDSPLLMRNSKINEILAKHKEMSSEMIKKIPEAVQNPILVLKSKTHPSQSVVAITDILTDKGEMIIPVWVNQEGNYLSLELGEDIRENTNFVASAYGRNVKNLLEYADKNNGFLYQNSDMERVRQLLARNGLQLPTPLKLSDSEIIVPQNEDAVNRKNSLSAEGEQAAPVGNYNVYGEDVALVGDDIAPIRDDIAPIREDVVRAQDAPTDTDDLPIRDDIAPPVKPENVTLTGDDIAPPVPETVTKKESTVLTGDDIAPATPGEDANEKPVKAKDLADEIVREEEVQKQVDALYSELINNELLQEWELEKLDIKIDRLQAEYDIETDKKAKSAKSLLRRIKRLQSKKNDVVTDYEKSIAEINEKIAELDIESNKAKKRLLAAKHRMEEGGLNTVEIDKKISSVKPKRPEVDVLPLIEIDQKAENEDTKYKSDLIGKYNSELKKLKVRMLNTLRERKNSLAGYDRTVRELQANLNAIANKKSKKAKYIEDQIANAKAEYDRTNNAYHKLLDNIEAGISRTDAKLKREIKRAAQREEELASVVASLTLPKMNSEGGGNVAQSLTSEPGKKKKKQRGWWSLVKENFFDNGMVFETLAKKTKNRQLEADWNSIRYAKSMAQRFLKQSKNGAKSIVDLEAEVRKEGLTKQLYDYMHHKHNVDRMSRESKAQEKIRQIVRSNPILSELLSRNASIDDVLRDPLFLRNTATLRAPVNEIKRLQEIKNLPVFGENITADISRRVAAELEKKYPMLQKYAEEVYKNNRYLRSLLVDEGIITPELAQVWENMYPHYVPIRRDKPELVSPKKRRKGTSVSAPLKRAEGGDSDILPLFNSIALRAEQTYRAILKNRFGVELMNTLGSPTERSIETLDDAFAAIDYNDSLLAPGDTISNPKFTVFKDGEKVTFDITNEMYDAMKPAGPGMSYSSGVARKFNNVFRGLLTEWNLLFMATNAIKDTQDVLVNSQHPAHTIRKLPLAYKEIITKGKYYEEYLDNGGESNTYFDTASRTFTEEDIKLAKKVLGFIPGRISALNNLVEKAPRLAEYIASRKEGRSIEVSMLDAARVTTNFAAGGNLVKMLNRNGATFLNASFQGAVQQVRNLREAKMNGLKGMIGLVARYAALGIPFAILNGLYWGDDEEYEKLPEYVKQNYYIIGKRGSDKFLKIPKGRMIAVIQDASTKVVDLLTGDDEVDLNTFLDLAVSHLGLVTSNLAPNNAYEDHILSPIVQAAANKTWYGDDLVPESLQNVPAAEQYDESTDSISKWLGEKTNASPYVINYVLDQYSGFVGDMFLPMLTPEAEEGSDTFIGTLMAPVKDKFTVDSVMDNQNISDFYDVKAELTVNANSSKATDKDILASKYMNSVNTDISDLNAQKREIQNSVMLDSEKYNLIRDIQKQIVDLAEEAVESHENVEIDGVYASVGGVEFRYYIPNEESEDSPEWKKLSDKQVEKQNIITKALGVTKGSYWIYTDELGDIKADKDEDGKAISGSRRNKVAEYINSLDIDYGQRIILFKSEYPSEDKYNYDIVEYLNEREDLSREDIETILKELGFEITKNGTAKW